MKEALTPAVHSNREEKTSILAQLNQYKKEFRKATETKITEPPALTELRAQFTAAYENLKRVDRRMKNANGVEEFNKILLERTRARNEYSALKSELKKAEASLSQRKTKSRDMER